MPYIFTNKTITSEHLTLMFNTNIKKIIHMQFIQITYTDRFYIISENIYRMYPPVTRLNTQYYLSISIPIDPILFTHITSLSLFFYTGHDDV